MRNSATMLTKVGALALLLTGAALTAPRASAADFTDDFAGTTLKPQWTKNDPVGAGDTIAVNNGLTFTLSATPFDDWSTVNNGSRIEMPAPAGDFTMTGKLASVQGAEATPLENRNYHSVIFVAFSDTDKLYWGPYRSNGFLQLERAGVGNLGNVSITGLPASVQIVRTGTVYHFLYKLNDADPWLELKTGAGVPVTFNDSRPVTTVGIMQKTWEGVEVTAKWNSFSLLESQNFFQSINGTVATNGPSPSKLAAQLLNSTGVVQMTQDVAANGTFSFPAAAGNYSVRLVGSDLLTPTVDATKTVTVQSGQAATVSFTGIQVSPDLNPATDEKFAHNFPGPTLDANFGLEQPKAGATITVSNGLKISVPANNAFDYWNTIDESPKARIPAPAGDWTVSVNIAGTDAEGNPLVGNFNNYLGINFAPNDTILFTQSLRDSGLEVLRTGGADGSGVLDLGDSPSWVQVRKVGNKYSFYYKKTAAGDWLPFGPDGTTTPKVITDIRKPVDIELGVKTWDPAVSPAVVATFTDFNLEAVKITKQGAVTGTVATGGGGSPANAAIQIKNAGGDLVSIVNIAENGNYSTTVAEGTYTFTVVGNSVVPGQAGATKSVTVVSGQPNVADFTVNMYPPLVPGQGNMFTDPFNTATLKPEWTPEIPVAGPTITGSTTGLNIVMPGSRAFDIWAGIPADNPRLTLPNPGGDFIMTAKLNSVNDAEGNPVEGRNFHSVLYVHLGGSDAIMWGAYRSNNVLRLERSGTGYDPNVVDLVAPYWLQLRRNGNVYSFWYKQNDNDSWSQLMDNADPPAPRTITVPSPAERVGISQKTWEALGLTANWSNFSLESAAAPNPNTGCKGDANSDKKIDVNDAVAILRHATSISLLTGQARVNADIDGPGTSDASVNVADAVKVLQFIVNIPGTGISACQ